MSQRGMGRDRFTGRSGLAAGLLMGCSLMLAPAVQAQAQGEAPLSSAREAAQEVLKRVEAAQARAGDQEAAEAETPSFDELNSAATELNDALAGARAKLDELRQATELAAMAAALRDELEASVQENNRLAARVAELEADRGELDAAQKASAEHIAELNRSVSQSQREIADLSNRLEARLEEIETAEQSLNNAERQVGTMEQRLAESDRQVSQLTDQIDLLQGTLIDTQKQLDTARAAAETSRSERDVASRELDQMRLQIASMLRSVLLGGEPLPIGNQAAGGAEGAQAFQVAAADAFGSAGEATAPEGDGFDDQATPQVATAQGEYLTLRASNIRAEPSPDAERVGFAERGETLTVTGKVSGRNWYRIETDNGVTGYIFGELIEPSV